MHRNNNNSCSESREEQRKQGLCRADGNSGVNTGGKQSEEDSLLTALAAPLQEISTIRSRRLVDEFPVEEGSNIRDDTLLTASTAPEKEEKEEKDDTLSTGLLAPKEEKATSRQYFADSFSNTCGGGDDDQDETLPAALAAPQKEGSK